jgi:hypothetical protein
MRYLYVCEKETQKDTDGVLPSLRKQVRAERLRESAKGRHNIILRLAYPQHQFHTFQLVSAAHLNRARHVRKIYGRVKILRLRSIRPNVNPCSRYSQHSFHAAIPRSRIIACSHLRTGPAGAQRHSF